MEMYTPVQQENAIRVVSCSDFIHYQKKYINELIKTSMHVNILGYGTFKSELISGVVINE